MIDFIRRYQLSKAREALRVAEAEVIALTEILNRTNPMQSYYVDQFIKARAQVALQKCRVDNLTWRNAS